MTRCRPWCLTLMIKKFFRCSNMKNKLPSIVFKGQYQVIPILWNGKQIACGTDFHWIWFSQDDSPTTVLCEWFKKNDSKRIRCRLGGADTGHEACLHARCSHNLILISTAHINNCSLSFEKHLMNNQFGNQYYYNHTLAHHSCAAPELTPIYWS